MPVTATRVEPTVLAKLFPLVTSVTVKQDMKAVIVKQVRYENHDIGDPLSEFLRPSCECVSCSVYFGIKSMVH